MMELCLRCQKDVETFTNRYSTMPQDTSNLQRHYEETICATCGYCIDRKEYDTEGI